MKTLLISLSLVFSFAACAAVTTVSPATGSATPNTAANTAVGMMAQLPVFLTRLDTLRGKALTVAEKAAVTNVVSQGNSTVNGIQSQFLGGVSKASGIDTATLGLLFPSATKPVSNSDVTSKIENKLGAKLGFVQKTAITSANTLRNNSLDKSKQALSNGVGQKLGMDPALVSGLLPLLGF